MYSGDKIEVPGTPITTMVATKMCFTVIGLFKLSYVKTQYKCSRDAQNGTELKHPPRCLSAGRF